MKISRYCFIILLIASSCGKDEIVPSKSCKDCSNSILLNDSIFDSLLVDTMYRRNEVRNVKIVDDCLLPVIWVSPCELTCSQYSFYATKSSTENHYEIKWEVLNNDFCTAFTSGELMPINISILQDTTKQEVFLKLFNYDEVIKYTY